MSCPQTTTDSKAEYTSTKIAAVPRERGCEASRALGDGFPAMAWPSCSGRSAGPLPLRVRSVLRTSRHGRPHGQIGTRSSGVLVFFSRPGTGLDPASSLPVRMMQTHLRLSQPKGSTPRGLDCLSVAFGVLFEHGLYIKQCGLSGVPSGRARAEHGRHGGMVWTAALHLGPRWQ